MIFVYFLTIDSKVNRGNLGHSFYSNMNIILTISFTKMKSICEFSSINFESIKLNFAYEVIGVYLVDPTEVLYG